MITTKSFRNVIKSLILSVVILSVSICSNAQSSQIIGTLKDTQGKAVTYASVVLKNKPGRIIGFGNSDDQGKYSILIPDTVHRISIIIEVNWLGYKKVQQQLIDGKNTYDFMLEEAIIELKEVQIKSRPYIKSKGDTLSYDVGSFSRREDRSIGDVIKHMPGLSVAENGQIAYNGKNITDLYIQGDDLMDGRYGLATRTITKEMIKSVDVMQHFQPVKVLKDKVFTNDVAINLVLKNENNLKLAGQAMLGGGLPQQYDVALNTMLFNKKIKMLNSLKGNNSGIDYQDEFNQYNLSDFLNSVDNNRPDALLSDATTGNPDIPRQNYYLNNSGVLNTNNLYNTRDSLQLKSNIQLFLDRSTFNYNSRVDNFLSTDTIHYKDLQNAIRRLFMLNTSLTAMVNKQTYYLRNNLHLNFGNSSNDSHMYFNGNTFDQHLAAYTHDFSNDCEWILALRNKDVINIRSYINYYVSPQRLYVGAGLDSNLLNNNLSYAGVKQNAEIPTLVSNLSVFYLVNKNRLIKQTYQVGLVNEWQKLNSDLNLTQLNGSVSAYKGDAGNSLSWQRNKVYINPTYGLKKDDWDAGLSIPLSWQSINYHQGIYGLDKRNNYFFVNSTAHIKFFVNAEDYLLANYSYHNTVGNISGAYKGLILANYRSLLYGNDADLQEQRSSNLSLNYNFQRNIIMLFINAGLNYNKVTANTILSSILTNNVQRTILLPNQNDKSTIAANFGISKYIFALTTTASLKATLGSRLNSQIINGHVFPFTNEYFSLIANISSKLFDDFTFNYIGLGTWYTSRQSNTNGSNEKFENQVRRFDQNFSLGYSPISNLFFNVKGRQVYSHQVNTSDINYLFLDTNIRYKLRKLRMDIEVDITNILNIEEYKVFTLSSNQFAVSSFDIRGRMAIVRATFNL